MNSVQNTPPSGRSIARNTSFLSMAYILQKIFAFVYFTLIARLIGPQEIGRYIFVISITTILSIFMDLGLTPVLIRETAKFREKTYNYLNNILSVKLIFAIFSYIALFVIIQVLDKDPMTNLMLYISGLVMIFDAFTLSFWGIFRGRQNLKYESISIIVNQIIIITVGLTAILIKFPVYVLIIALLCASMFSFIYSYLLIKIKENYKFKFTVNKEVLSLLFKIAIPFALAGIFTRVYSYIDQVMLSVLIDDTHLGWYSVAYKITFALQFIPSAIAASIYPAMSSYFVHAKDKLPELFERSMYILMILSIPITFGVITVANDLILLLYTQTYQNSILSLRILITAVPAIFLAFPVGAMLNSCDRQKINTINLGITMLLNIILNIILIPKYQHIGASIASTISLYYLFLSNLYFVKTITAYNLKYLLKTLIATITASIIMSGFVYFILPFSLLVAILVGAVTYILCAFIFKIVTINEINFLKKFFKKNE